MWKTLIIILFSNLHHKNNHEDVWPTFSIRKLGQDQQSYKRIETTCPYFTSVINKFLQQLIYSYFTWTVIIQHGKEFCFGDSATLENIIRPSVHAAKKEMLHMRVLFFFLSPDFPLQMCTCALDPAESSVVKECALAKEFWLNNSAFIFNLKISCSELV